MNWRVLAGAVAFCLLPGAAHAACGAFPGGVNANDSVIAMVANGSNLVTYTSQGAAGSARAGMIVYNRTDNKLYVCDDTAWQSMMTGASGATQWVNGSSGAIYYNGGNVGIGTTTPNAALNVNGSAGLLSVGAEAAATAAKLAEIYQGYTGTSDAFGLHIARYQTTNANTNTVYGAAVSAGGYGLGSNALANAIGVYTQAYQGSTGTVTNAYSLYSDSPTGTVTNAYNIYANGTAKSYFGGNVGIGTASPGSLLDANGGVTIGNGTANGLRTRANNGAGSFSILYGDATNNVALDNGMGGDVWLGTGGTEYMRVKSGGNVGIGTTAPATKLDVRGGIASMETAGVGYVLLGNTDGSGAALAMAASGWSPDNQSGDTILRSASGKNIILDNGGTGAKIFIKGTTGNVGIGTTNPQTSLDVAGGARVGTDATCTAAKKGMLAWNSDVLMVCTEAGSFINIASSSTGPSQWLNGASNAIYYNTGNVGIGTTNPDEKLKIVSGSVVSVRTGALENNIRFQHTTDSNPTAAIGFSRGGTVGLYNGLVFSAYDGASWKSNMYIGNDGNVGIGTTSPGAKLDITSAGAWGDYTSGFDDVVGATVPSAPQYLLNRQISGSPTALQPTYLGGIAFSQNGVAGAGMYATNPNPNGSHLYRDIRFWTTRWDAGISDYRSGDRLVIRNDGNVGIGTSTPATKVEIVATDYNTALRIGSGGSYFNVGRNASDGAITLDGTAGAALFRVSTAGTQYLNADSTGLAVGTGAPLAGISTVKAISYFGLNSTFASNVAADSYMVMRNTNNGYKVALGNDGNGNLAFYTRGDNSNFAGTDERVRITSTGNVGIGTTSPDATAKLSVAGSTAAIDTASGIRTYRDLAFYSGAASETGTMKFTMPKTWSNTMMRVVIKGYSYTGVTGAWEVVIGAYNYTGPYWTNYSAEIRGKAPFTQVRLGHDGTKNVILLGDTSTVWAYPRMEVSELLATHSGISDWGSGWTIAAVTDESGIGSIVTPSVQVAGTPASGNAGAVQFSGGSGVLASDAANFFWDDTNNRLGIGTATPGARLEIADPTRQSTFQNNTKGSLNVSTGDSTTGDFTTLTLGDASNQKLGKIAAHKTASGSYLYFGTSNNYASGITNNGLVLDYNGNVGIGTTSPGAKLQISSGGTGSDWPLWLNSTIKFRGDGVVTWGAVADYGELTWDTGVAKIAAQSGKALALAANGSSSEYIRITTSGNVGIGTTGPAARLDVAGEVRIGETGLACSSTTEGAQRYNFTSKTIEFCNGSTWNSFFSQSADPNAFSFNDQTGVNLNTTITSNAVSVAGFPGSLTATCNNCTAIARNGAWGGTVVSGFTSGDTIAIRQLSSASVGTATTATATVGGTVSGTWTVTTTGSSPNAFGFTDVTNATTGISYSTGAVALTGFTGALSATCNNCTGIARNGVWGVSPLTGFAPGDTIAIRQTSSPGAGVTVNATVTLGSTTSSPWSVTTASACAVGITVGQACPDGMIYAGFSPDGNVPMYTTPCDAGQTWNGSACTGTRTGITWNNGTGNWTDTGFTSHVTGLANTAGLAALVDAGSPYNAANYCGNLSAHGHDDWYLPARNELHIFYGNRTAIGGFDVGGGQWYWSASEYSYNSAWIERFSDGTQTGNGKYNGYYVRCARR